LVASVIGVVAIAEIIVMVSSLKTYPPPVQTGGGKEDKLRDIGPRVVTVQRIVKPEPIPRSELVPEIDIWQQPQEVMPDVWPVLPPKVVAKPEVKDVCAKHNMRKVWVNDKYWRCRK
jgi:hypothetical protein